jgi:hypothetical protein
LGDAAPSVSIAEQLNVHSLSLQVLVVLEWVEAGGIVLVWRSVILLERSVGLALCEVGVHLSAEVELGEESVVGNPVVLGGSLVVPEVLEVGGVRVGKVEGPVRVSIVDAVQFSSLHELDDIVLDDWALSVGSMHSSGGLSLNSVSKSKDVFESGMLQGVGVDINQTSVVGDTCVNKLLVSDGGRIDVCTEEWLLDDLTAVDISESSDLLSDVAGVDLGHLPAEHDINASLVALVEGNLVGVGESEDLPVRSPVLNSGTSSGSTVELVLSHEGLVVESIEVVTFTLVWALRGVANHVSVVVGPTVVVVTRNSLLMVKLVDEHVFLFRTLLKSFKTLNQVGAVIETRSENEGFVSVLSSV